RCVWTGSIDCRTADCWSSTTRAANPSPSTPTASGPRSRNWRPTPWRSVMRWPRWRWCTSVAPKSACAAWPIARGACRGWPPCLRRSIGQACRRSGGGGSAPWCRNSSKGTPPSTRSRAPASAVICRCSAGSIPCSSKPCAHRLKHSGRAHRRPASPAIPSSLPGLMTSATSALRTSAMNDRPGAPPGQEAAATVLLAEDAAARSAALIAQESLLLQAPAGSGKTTVLTARFLTLLADVDCPEEILAITFTRKAAAEMRQRILMALQAAEGGQVPSGLTAALLQRARQRDRQCGWELLRNPARLRVETIDALNNRLARMLPVSARAAPGLTLARHPNALYQRAAVRTLEAAWLEPASRPAAQLLFERLDNSWQRLQRLLTDMLRHRSHWLPRMLEASGSGLVERVHESLQSLLTAELAIAC